ncbi:hypothetical protein HY988_06560 [Candidatus Micrarchaeota archaeon]|nr:hypothetical protein [Candidatus Micrarchaeota archaeon]
MKRGQATIEFLMTYGWAILVLLIVIGVILSSGILSPTFVLSEQCGFGNNMPCNVAIYNQNGVSHVSLSLYNSLPYKIDVTKAVLTSENGQGTFVLDGGLGPIESASSINVSFTVQGDPLTAKSVKKLIGSITYRSCAPELANGCNNPEHTVTGTVVARVIGE